MAIIKLYNTLTKNTEVLTPVHEGKVGMYHCGPTVYDYPHIGNIRAYTFADTLRRTCEHVGYEVDQVINITDVGHIVADADTGEDKMEKSAHKSGKSAQEIANYFTEVFMQNLSDMNIKTEGTHFPRATGYIDEQIELILHLEQHGHAYTTSDGVYFNVATFPDYGKLGNIDLKGLEAGHRIGENDEKKTPYDFALWKFSPTDGPKRQQEWPSPWGTGFPGWHIECSAMSQQILGETFDIHTGGIDHIPVHHNNEIAQSECISHKPLTNIWMHGAFLNWKDRKMSKSDGTFTRLQDIVEKGISPLAFRYFLLQSKYRQEVVFDMEVLEASQTAYKRLLARIKAVLDMLPANAESSVSALQKAKNTITEMICDDLNTPQVLAFTWEFIKDDQQFNQLSQSDFKKLIENIDSLLGLRLTEAFKIIEIPEHIQILIDARSKARQEKNWTESDRLREEIKSLGFEVRD